ncbi:MAG: hypothetical protein JSV92_00375 [archaeon]|nr:MAG: hypothetical protein JSV92_00375 [archaeon]
MEKNEQLKPIFSQIYEINPENIRLEKYFDILEPMKKDQHTKIIFNTLHKFDGSLYPRKGAEIKYQINDTKFLQDYKAYILKPDWVGITIAKIVAEKPNKTIEKQKVYTHSFKVWTENTNKVIEELALAYSKKGAQIWPRTNFTMGEIHYISIASGVSEKEFSDGIDVALDVGYIEKSGMEERFFNGKKVIVPTFGIPADVGKSLDCFARLVIKDYDKNLPKKVLPTFIQSQDLETEY